MTQEELQAIRERCGKATPGPWKPTEPHWSKNRPRWNLKQSVQSAAKTVTVVFGAFRENYKSENFMDSPDALFIAHARTDLPKALDEIERQAKAIERLRGALENVKEPINNLTSADALEYHADVCRTVNDALEGME